MLKADFCARPIFGSDVGSAHLGHIHKLNWWLGKSPHWSVCRLFPVSNLDMLLDGLLSLPAQNSWILCLSA
jgi:hypothetical protein